MRPEVRAIIERAAVRDVRRRRYLEDLPEPEPEPPCLPPERRPGPHRDLDEVDAGVLGPSVDAERALQEDWRRVVEMDEL